MTSIISPAEILEKKIVYTVEGVSPINPDEQLQQVGIDLRLARAYEVYGSCEFYHNKAETIRPDLIELQLHNGSYVFQAGRLYSIDFLEDVSVPEGMAGIVRHRSTFNRFSGTIQSGWYDSGFKSKGGCGASFRPDNNTTVEIGFRMAQIVFYTANNATMYSGQYQNQ